MSVGRSADVALLRKLSPLDGMKNDNLAALARKVSVNELAANRNLFKEGDTDRRVIQNGLVFAQRILSGRAIPRRR